MDQGKAWGRIIFFSIGAILFGLGIILLFAYNWERMHKFAKLAVIVLALLSVHGSGLWLRRPGGRYRSAGEGLHLAGTMFFGAGIWLVAQIYHIDEHYPNAFFIWGCGALAMAWAYPPFRTPLRRQFFCCCGIVLKHLILRIHSNGLHLSFWQVLCPWDGFTGHGRCWRPRSAHIW